MTPPAFGSLRNASVDDGERDPVDEASGRVDAATIWSALPWPLLFIHRVDAGSEYAARAATELVDLPRGFRDPVGQADRSRVPGGRADPAT